jgi:hypothetical protein
LESRRAIPKLANLGVTLSQPSRGRCLAEPPEKDFEALANAARQATAWRAALAICKWGFSRLSP